MGRLKAKTLIICPDCGTSRQFFPSAAKEHKTAYCRPCSNERQTISATHAQVLTLLAQGLTGAEIGRRMGLSRQRTKAISLRHGIKSLIKGKA